MDATDRRRNRGRLPAGLLGMLALVGAVERFVARHDLDFATEWSADRRFVARAVDAGAADCPILCFGDSQAKFGVAPAVLTEGLGAPAYNLAVHGGQPPSSYFLLRRVLRSGRAPRAIVVDFKPGLLRNPPQNYVRPWAELATLAEALDLARTARDGSFFGQVALARLLPTARARYELRASVRAALRGESASKRATLTNLRRNWRRNRGAQVMPGGLFYPVAFEAIGEYQGRWSCDPLNAAYLRRFLGLAEARGIPVFWLLPPVQPKIQDAAERTGFEDTFARFVRSTQARYANLVVVDGRHSRYDESAFIDSLHLNRRGAAALSAGLAGVIAHHLGRAGDGPRWQALPAFAARDEDRPLEDIIQSDLALKQAAATARR